MKSMTSFGYAKADTSFELSVEIKSYNSKFLDIYVNLPHNLTTLEPFCRNLLANHFKRGKVELHCRFKQVTESGLINHNKILEFKELISELLVKGLNIGYKLSDLEKFGLFAIDEANLIELSWDKKIVNLFHCCKNNFSNLNNESSSRIC